MTVPAVCAVPVSEQLLPAVVVVEQVPEIELPMLKLLALAGVTENSCQVIPTPV